MLEFTDLTVEEAVTSGKIVVVDFFASWCGPCIVLAPIIESLAAEYPDIKIGKLNVDEHTKFPAKHSIRSIPTVLFFKDGKLVDKQIGATKKAIYQEKINNLIT